MKRNAQAMANQSSIDSKQERVIVANTPDYLLFLAFMVVWILPLLWAGTVFKPIPFAGKYLNDQIITACLFTNRVSHWTTYYIQVQSDVNPEWVSVAVRDYFPMQPFGYMSRMHVMVSRSVNARRGMLLRQRMAEFIKVRYEELDPRGAEPVSVRFVVIFTPVGEELASQTGHWVKPPLDTISRNQWRVLSTHFFDGRPPLNRRGVPERLRGGTLSP